MAVKPAEGHQNMKPEPSREDGSDFKYAVIVAAGSGQRAGGGLPKQFHEIAGIPMLWHSVRAFIEADHSTRIILVLSQDGKEIWSKLSESLSEADRKLNDEVVAIADGGQTRTESVANALKVIAAETNGKDCLIAVHDAARPLATVQMIRAGWKAARQKKAVVPVVPVTDSLRQLGDEGSSKAVDRSQFVAVQTPQIFDGKLLMTAYRGMNPETTYTDDASVVEALHPISLYPGDPANFKVTLPHDFLIANHIFASSHIGK